MLTKVAKLHFEKVHINIAKQAKNDIRTTTQ